MQSFFLATQERGYFVLNDTFRYMEPLEHSMKGFSAEFPGGVTSAKYIGHHEVSILPDSCHAAEHYSSSYATYKNQELVERHLQQKAVFAAYSNHEMLDTGKLHHIMASATTNTRLARHSTRPVHCSASSLHLVHLPCSCIL